MNEPIDYEALRQELIRLDEVNRNNAVRERHACLLLIALMAEKLGLTVGRGGDCFYVDLPSGQVVWRLDSDYWYMFDRFSPGRPSWDNHDAEEKYRRVIEPGL